MIDHDEGAEIAVNAAVVTVMMLSLIRRMPENIQDKYGLAGDEYAALISCLEKAAAAFIRPVVLAILLKEGFRDYLTHKDNDGLSGLAQSALESIISIADEATVERKH